MSQRANIVILATLSILAVLPPCSCECKLGANEGSSNVQGMFVFGSSVVDNGNNNYLEKCSVKANFLPYGVDFPGGATGRYSNGKNVIDLLVDHLKLPHPIPPFKDPLTKGYKILHGVNFGSGASGILDDTGDVAGQVITLNEQIRNFETVTLPELEGQLGCRSNESLGNYLFVVATGNNDFSLNYFLRFPNNNVTLLPFIDKVITTLSQQLQSLYNLGARKFVIMSIYPNGCSPPIRARVPKPIGCIHTLNLALLLYNVNLRNLVDDLTQKMPGSKLVYVNAIKIIWDIILTPNQYGFEDTKNTCCQVLTVKEGGNGTLCKMGGNTCPSRKNFVFFDGLHPTEAVNAVLANKAFASDIQDEVYPTNIKHLLEE